MPANSAFEAVINDLQNASRPFPAHHLHNFSDISLEDLQILKEAWKNIPLKRRQALLEDLRDLAETDTLTNFDDIGKAFLDDPDPEVRILATRLLWECEDKRLAALFLKALQTDPVAEVQAASATALGLFVYLGELDSVPAKLLTEIEGALLEKARSDPSKSVRRSALEALGYCSRTEVQKLIETAIHQKDPDWVVSALVAMGRSSDEHWEKHILARLRHANDDIRAAAINAAGEIGLAATRQPLLDMLEDEEDVEVRHSIIQALARIGGEDVRVALHELVELEEDEEELELLDEALNSMLFTGEDGSLDMFDLGTDEDLPEEFPDPEDPS